MSAVAAEKKEQAPATETGVFCVLDLGEQKKKRVKKLRKGEGRLMEKVEDAIADLQAEGVLEAKVQTVVVVVREEFSLSGVFDNDD
jgi:hypothetical protein